MLPSVSASIMENVSKCFEHSLWCIYSLYAHRYFFRLRVSCKKIWSAILVIFMLKILSLLWPLISTESTATRLEICKWGLSRNQWLLRRQNIFHIIAWDFLGNPLWSSLSPVSTRALSFLRMVSCFNVSPCHPVLPSPHLAWVPAGNCSCLFCTTVYKDKDQT